MPVALAAALAAVPVLALVAPLAWMATSALREENDEAPRPACARTLPCGA